MATSSERVVGLADHIGWADLVVLELRGGAPAVAARRRVELIDAGLPSAPYHHESLELPLAEAEQLVATVCASVASHAREVWTELTAQGQVRAAVLRASPYEELPGSLGAIRDSRALTCAADGMLYREALASAALEAGIAVRRFARRVDPAATSADELGRTRAEIVELVAGLGRSVGPPWRREHREVVAAALPLLFAPPDASRG